MSIFLSLSLSHTHTLSYTLALSLTHTITLTLSHTHNFLSSPPTADKVDEAESNKAMVESLLKEWSAGGGATEVRRDRDTYRPYECLNMSSYYP